MRNIILNKSNIVPGTSGCCFSYRFPTTQMFDGMQIALGNLAYNQSIFNITPALKNNTFSYIWNAATPETIQVDLLQKIPNSPLSTNSADFFPGGIFRLQDINAYLQYAMYYNKHYLIDDTGNIVYYISITVNRVYYGYEISCDPLPAVLPTGWSIPAGATWSLPATDATPQLVIPSTNIQQLLGFPADSYPTAAQATTFNQLSPNVPQINPTTSVLIACSLVDNNLQYPNQVFYAFINNDQIAGTPVDIRPNEYAFINLQDGPYNELQIRFLNQNFDPIAFHDAEITMNLLLCQRCTPIAPKDSFFTTSG